MKRISFSKISDAVSLPDLVEIQKVSYANFLQADVPRTKRKAVGLQGVFLNTFPIDGPDGTYRLEFVNYSMGKPKYSEEEARRRGLTYAIPLKARIRLVTKKEIKEQEVYICDLPLMTNKGTFVINGDERVVVSQLHRSPGISFEETIHPNGKRMYSGRIVPYHGSWIEFEFDLNDVLYVILDRKRKFFATSFLRALGLSTDEEILKAFCGIEDVKVESRSQLKELTGRILAEDIKMPDSEHVLIPKYTRLSKENLLDRDVEFIPARVRVLKNNVMEIVNTLKRDFTKNQEEALMDIYRKLRPGYPSSAEAAKSMLEKLFFDPKRYDLERVGRYLINRKLNMDTPLEKRVLDLETVIAAVKYLLNLKEGVGDPDDIDHLGNRRVRTVGELLENQFRVGMLRMERIARERMNIYDMENVMPHHLINSKLIASAVRDFFLRSQLSQFMDQTNPLAELTHRRRLSALGPGGLDRERAGFEVRDVHYSHYGRVCPVETPEGPNIGLIVSLSTFARVNEFGLLETPYRKVINGRVTNRIEYLTADVEDKFMIAQANAKLDKEGKLIEDLVFCRYKDNFLKVEPKRVDYMDVSPRQLVSVSASLIPFLEHDDANRALMGSNMQRQAVPLLFPEVPFVMTGMEKRVAIDSGTVVLAKKDGVVREVQADRIVVGSDIYELKKFLRSNADTCVNQRPIVKVGDRVKEGDVIADGSATKDGELALGRNVLVAFMSWRGYNFEDAILISEKLLKDDTLTSLHIEEFSIEARETKLGPEEITRDIPGVGEEALKDLDENGIIRIGAEVKSGDILVGKVTPKTETELTPEEKLLRAIFGEKAGDVRDASLTVPPGVEGTVVDVRIFSRKEAKPRSKEVITEELKQINAIKEQYQKQIKEIKEERNKRLSKLLLGQKLSSALLDIDTGETVISQDKTITKKDLHKLDKCDLDGMKIKDNEALEEELRKVMRLYDDQMEELIYEQEREIDQIKRGDELPAGVLKKVVVYVASKRRLSVGDKIAGRHGNKGVIARILAEEDMPFLPDGTPVEIVLNPLGVPSRMNVGQLLETQLGWAARELGIQVISPVFGGANEEEIKEQLRKANLPEDGRITLRDGYTGEVFDNKVTVGYIYMMKLIHLVDEKIHARSIGPYSLVTQQPLGGKAQFGGQRFGEMEVWALEAYGSAYTLQELLTVKSDDVEGRTRIYEAIVKGENALNPGTPESFNVLVKELQGLCLDIKKEKKKA
ncbi:MAG: DNA-directed RNA polymerase subunit beta [Candidatus Omnitrophica bacterium]|nr:DNA-directed RNA polymerase subunit beta [Candidatus Omnitrophota bacterium]